MSLQAGLYPDRQYTPGSVGVQPSLSKKGAAGARGNERIKADGGAPCTSLDAARMDLEVIVL